MAKMTSYSASYGEGKYLIEAIAVVNGKDVAIVAGGGTDYHIGAAVLSVPRPSRTNPSRFSSSSSVICVTGHKEDELARNASASLASELGCVVTVSAGIHIDGASAVDIKILQKNFSNVTNQLKEILKTHFQRK
jgi:gallate decarboxylase subunit D